MQSKCSLYHCSFDVWLDLHDLLTNDIQTLYKGICRKMFDDSESNLSLMVSTSKYSIEILTFVICADCNIVAIFFLSGASCVTVISGIGFLS